MPCAAPVMLCTNSSSRKALAIAVLVSASNCVQAQTLKDYFTLRKKYGITAAAGVAALDTLIGTRVVEIQGTVKGSILLPVPARPEPGLHRPESKAPAVRFWPHRSE